MYNRLKQSACHSVHCGRLNYIEAFNWKILKAKRQSSRLSPVTGFVGISRSLTHSRSVFIPKLFHLTFTFFISPLITNLLHSFWILHLIKLFYPQSLAIFLLANIVPYLVKFNNKHDCCVNHLYVYMSYSYVCLFLFVYLFTISLLSVS